MGFFLLALVASFGFWAYWFEIDQIVRAQGQVVSESKTQVIQAADGGVIREIKVSEGERVRKGEVIALLESERANANLEEISNRIAALSISRLRAIAEASDMYSPQFGQYTQTHPELVRAQRALFIQNKSALNKDTSALNEQLTLAKDEFERSSGLFQTGDVSNIELMRVKRGVVEAKQKLDAVSEKFKSDARRELARTEEELASQRSKLQERQSVVNHTDIQAPLDGIIKSIRLNTLGGVLRAGDELMQISPTVGDLLIEARINPADIGQLRVGLPVTVKLDAFDFGVYGSLQGQLSYLSSDTLTEQAPDGKNQVYYRARITLDPMKDGGRIHPSDVKTGMTASLDIRTGKRSVLTFIAKPIVKAFHGALGQK